MIKIIIFIICCIATIGAFSSCDKSEPGFVMENFDEEDTTCKDNFELAKKYYTDLGYYDNNTLRITRTTNTEYNSAESTAYRFDKMFSVSSNYKYKKEKINSFPDYVYDVYCNDEYSFEIIFHEYTHYVMSERAKILKRSELTKELYAVFEGYADAMTCLITKDWMFGDDGLEIVTYDYDAYVDNDTLIENEYSATLKKGLRNIADPLNRLNNAFDSGIIYYKEPDPCMNDSDYAHQYGFLVSHAIYLMNTDESNAIDSEVLLSLLYESMIYYDKDTDLFDICDILIKTAEDMEKKDSDVVSEEGMKTIRYAFAKVGLHTGTSDEKKIGN